MHSKLEAETRPKPTIILENFPTVNSYSDHFFMDIRQFLDLSAGKWFSQRTNYLLSGDKADNSKADITIELIFDDDVRMIQLCQEHNVDPQTCLGGTVQSWDTSVDWGKPKQLGSSAIALIPHPEDPSQGQFLTQAHMAAKGHYTLGEDEALTLILDTEDLYAEERQWFASENLRLRTIMMRDRHGRQQTSFYSEIRKAPPKE